MNKKDEKKSIHKSSDKEKVIESKIIVKKVKKAKRNITSGIAFVQATFNNTIILSLIHI